MFHAIRRLRVGAGAALLLAGTAAHAVDLELTDVPAPIMEAVKFRFPEAKVMGAAQEETPEKKLIYEVALEEKTKNIDVSLTSEGAIFLIEKQIARKDLPKPALAALDKEFPKARYRTVVEVIEVKDKEEKLVSYEALLTTPQKQVRNVELGLDGAITRVEKLVSEEEDE